MLFFCYGLMDSVIFTEFQFHLRVPTTAVLEYFVKLSFNKNLRVYFPSYMVAVLNMDIV